MWMPLPIFWAGSITVAAKLSVAPSSGWKKAMITFLVFALLWIIPFIAGVVAVLVSAVSAAFSGEGSDFLAANAVSATLTVLWIVFMLGFIVAADYTFLSTFPQPTAARYVRGANLLANLTGMLVFPLFGIFGVIYTLLKLNKIPAARSSGSWRALTVLGGFTLLLLVTAWLTIIILSEIPETYYYNSPMRWCEPDRSFQNFKRQINDTTTLEMTTANVTSLATTTTLATTTLAASTLVATTLATTTLAATTSALQTFATTTTFFFMDRTICFVSEGSPVTFPLIFSSAGATAVAVLVILWWFTHLAFVIVSDVLILKILAAESPPAAVVVAGAPLASNLVSPCAQCQAPLSWTPTGAKTQVRCYQCNSVVEFAVSQAVQQATAPNVT